MGAYEPLSFKSATTIAAYRIVKVSSAQTVTLADTVTAIPIGISKNSTLNPPVVIAGEALLEFNQTVAAGALVATNAVGQGVAHVDATAGTYVIGYALEAVDATGTIAKVLVNPFFKSIP